jgi:hypothetical protein
MSATNRTGNYLGILSAFFLIILMALSCAPPRIEPRLVTTECAPSNLTVRTDDHKMYLKWDTNCPEGTLLSGYYIYILEEPIHDKYHNIRLPKSIKPHGQGVYPGDTDPESSFETISIENLENGIEYFISVRTVFPDKSVSASSNEVNVICRPEGRFELSFRYSALNDGFSFGFGEPVRADSDRNDIYFYSKDDYDFIASPHRLNGFLKKSKFYSLGKTKDIYQYPNIELDFAPVEKIPIFEGESYLIKTAEGNFAKLRIEKISGENKERKLDIKYIYQTARNLARF